MLLEQISVFLENKPGALEEVLGILGQYQVNIRTLSLADTADFGILRLIVDEVDHCMKVLKERNLTVSRTEVIAVEVPDRSGGLAEIMAPLREGGVNIEYLYAFVEKTGQNAVIIFRFDSMEKAREVLLQKNFQMVSPERLYGL